MEFECTQISGRYFVPRVYSGNPNDGIDPPFTDGVRTCSADTAVLLCCETCLKAKLKILIRTPPAERERERVNPGVC